jgi:hypothetical protein
MAGMGQGRLINNLPACPHAPQSRPGLRRGIDVVVESRMGAVAWGLWPTPRFPSPLIDTDMPISGIRLGFLCQGYHAIFVFLCIPFVTAQDVCPDVVCITPCGENLSGFAGLERWPG